MKKLLMICALAVLIVAAGSAQAGLNSSFETGDLTGWTAVVPAGASVTVVTGHADITWPTGVPPVVPGVTAWGPTDGTYFGLVKTDGPGSITQLYQSFYASAGDILSFDYFWDSQDYAPFDDTTTGTLLSGVGTGGALVTNLFFHNIGPLPAGSGTDPGNHYGTPWTSVSLQFAAGGMYTLLITNTNGLDSALDSYVGIDNVVIPAPGAILLGGIGAGLVGWLRRRRTL